MRLQTILLGIILAVASPLLVFGCGNTIKKTNKKTELPQEIPAETEMSFSENGGMSPAYKSINVSGNTLTIKEKTLENRTDKIWHSEISVADKTELYQAFVDNKFDLITNDKRGETVYDAPSSGISIRAGDKNCRVSEGDNFPLSGENAKRWSNIRAAFEQLEVKYKDNLKLKVENFAVIRYEAKSHRYIFKGINRPANLSDSEVENIEKIVRKNVETFNSKQKEFGKINDLSLYNFQYIPVYNSKMEKEVWVNAFCYSFYVYWKKEIVEVKDGGSCYFNLKINLKTSNVYDFQVNGEA